MREFPVINILSEWVLEPEEMGSKRKFWYRAPGENQRRWLFKSPQERTGQHWAEKIAAEIAGVLGIRRAAVELAGFNGQQGSATKSFVHSGLELVHGNQLLSTLIQDYEPEKRFHQADHTVENILTAVDTIFGDKVSKIDAKSRLAEYLVLDAMIGNTDRHHENWGVLRRRKNDVWYGVVAPSFDHASSLGRELLDDRRDRLLTENRVGNYVERGRGAIYWSTEGAHGPSPIELVRRTAPCYPDIFRPALTKIEKLDETLVDDLLARMPEEWMSRSAKEFATALMRYSIGQLKEVLR